MAVIGVDLEQDQLVLTRGRDFKWTLENVDDSNPPQPLDYPAGDLFIELQTRNERNAIQSILVTGADAGTYKLGYGDAWSTAIDFGDVVDNPHNLSGDITDALESIPALNGNIVVSPSSLYPVWELDLTVNAGHVLTEQLVNTLNTTITSLYNTFAELLGVTVDFTIHDNLNTVVKVTSNKSFDEVGLITFATNVTSTVITNAFNAVTALLGIFNVIHVDFYWNHTYTVEFVNELGLQPLEPLSVDYSLLTGINQDEVKVEATVIEPGKAPTTKWPFIIDGSQASIKIENEVADQIASRTEWQLVFLPEGEASGGDAIGEGVVKIKMPNAYIKESE